MHTNHPKTVRRRLLQLLYERYQANPLEMLTPDDILEDGAIARSDLLANIYYLSDKGLVELLTGYNPPMFAAARITADGIDMVENRYEFDLLFPPSPGEEEAATAAVPLLMERLLQEAEFSAVDGEHRRNLIRDVLYLREELSRPVVRWRRDVIETVLAWIGNYYDAPNASLPSLPRLRESIAAARE